MKNLAGLEQRLWQRVTKGEATECWMWGGATSRNGYGYLKRSSERRNIGAHCAAWVVTHGTDVPEGFDVMHACDNRLCCNPAHLSVGTRLENMQDMDAKGRRVNMQVQGARHPAAKLSEQDVRDIRDSSLSSAALARQYGVTHTAIRHVRLGKNWRHVA